MEESLHSVFHRLLLTVVNSLGNWLFLHQDEFPVFWFVCHTLELLHDYCDFFVAYSIAAQKLIVAFCVECKYLHMSVLIVNLGLLSKYTRCGKIKWPPKVVCCFLSNRLEF